MFDDQTKHKNDKVRVLFVDGHASHCTLPFLRYAKAHNIIVISYPPHATHALQGLDVACFGSLKTNWAKERGKWEEENGTKVRKSEFLQVYGPAREQTFTKPTILSSFRRTGIVPFDPSVITKQQLAPATVHSTKGSFPLPQNSPVRAVMAAFHSVSGPPPTLNLLPSPSDIPSSPINPVPAATLRALDPSLFTPTKRVAALHTLLQSTSVAYLTSTESMSSSAPIPALVLEAPPPTVDVDWSVLDHSPPSMQASKTMMLHEINALRAQLFRARGQCHALGEIVRGDHAQMVIQNMILEKQQRQLRAKETQEPLDRTKLITQQRHLTDDAFLATLEGMETQEALEREEGARSAQKRKTDAQRRKERKVWREGAVKRKEAGRKSDMDQWQVEQTAGLARGMRKKDLPPPKARQREPTPSEYWSSGDERRPPRLKSPTPQPQDESNDEAPESEIDGDYDMVSD